MRRRILHRLLLILIAIDVLLMTTFFGGKRNETISSCAWSLELCGKRHGKILRRFIDWLFCRLQEDHCQKAYLSERKH